MGDSFKPTVEGMNFGNIDGAGWPLSVCVGNGGDILYGGYECRDYVPERSCRNVGGDEWGFMCSECGGHTHGSPFHVPDEERKMLAEMLGGRIVSLHGSVPRFCPNCGARVVFPIEGEYTVSDNGYRIHVPEGTLNMARIGAGAEKE